MSEEQIKEMLNKEPVVLLWDKIIALDKENKKLKEELSKKNKIIEELKGEKEAIKVCALELSKNTKYWCDELRKAKEKNKQEFNDYIKFKKEEYDKYLDRVNNLIQKNCILQEKVSKAIEKLNYIKENDYVDGGDVIILGINDFDELLDILGDKE